MGKNNDRVVDIIGTIPAQSPERNNAKRPVAVHTMIYDIEREQYRRRINFIVRTDGFRSL